jgi:hypothetical protein
MFAAGLAYDRFLLRAFGSAASLSRILGDSVSIAFGSVGLTAGLLFALYILGKGIDIPAQRKYSLAGKMGTGRCANGNTNDDLPVDTLGSEHAANPIRGMLHNTTHIPAGRVLYIGTDRESAASDGWSP